MQVQVAISVQNNKKSCQILPENVLPFLVEVLSCVITTFMLSIEPLINHNRTWSHSHYACSPSIAQTWHTPHCKNKMTAYHTWICFCRRSCAGLHPVHAYHCGNVCQLQMVKGKKGCWRFG